MMCLVFRFKACTVCKTVGVWTSTLFSAQIKKCQLKVKHIGFAISPCVSFSFFYFLSLYLPQPQ